MRADEVAIEKGIDLLDTFISGSDRSDAFVGRLGVFFDRHLSESELIEDLVIAAASYDCVGGDLLFDEKSFLELCVSARSILEKRAGSGIAGTALSANRTRTRPTTYTKAEFGESLLDAVKGSYDETELARWAYEVYLDHANHLEPGLYEEMMKIVSLDGGDEFMLTRSQIQEIGRRLTGN